MCNQNTEKCLSSYGEDLPDCCYNILNDMLKNIIKIFEKHELNYWLDWGSLLGLIREGKLIRFDTDLDFGIFLNDLDKIKNMKSDFDEIGYNLCITNCSGGCFPKIYYSQKNNLYADIWLWDYVEDSLRLMKVNEEYSKINRVPKYFYENLETIEFNDIKIKIPSNIEKYLEFRFGKDWRIPDRHFYRNNQAHSNKIRAEQIKLAGI